MTPATCREERNVRARGPETSVKLGERIAVYDPLGSVPCEDFQ